MKTSLVAGLLGGAATLLAVAFLARSWRSVALVVPILLYLAVGATLSPPKLRVAVVRTLSRDRCAGFSMPGESGNWREFGLRERLGVILHGDVYEGSSFERDFFFYGDQRSLEEQLARTLSLALERGPLVWLQMAERLMSAEPDSGED